MPVTLLPDIRSMRMHDDGASFVAGAVGFLVGAGFEAVFRGCTNAAGPAWTLAEVIKPGLVSSWMAVGCLNAMRCLDRETPSRQLQPHERALVDYPAVRQRLIDGGTSVEDLDALKELAGALEAEFNWMISQFNDYCRKRNTPPNPLMPGVIRHFYLTHCAERGVMLLSSKGATACYLVAAREEQRRAIEDGMNQPGTRAGTVLRQLHCPYLRVDLANNALRDANAFAADDSGGEMCVRPVQTSFEIGPLVEVTNRRLTGHHGVRNRGSRRSTELSAASTCASARVTRSPRLRRTLTDLGLPPSSRTWRELNRIEEDLAAGRPCGHLIVHNGREYMSCDIHLEGRQSPGRNAWRLLYLNCGDGHELVDIVDYHRPRS